MAAREPILSLEELARGTCFEVPEDPRCQICDKERFQYTCPRCYIAYCSAECYRNPFKHLQCSESFYRECVYQKMKHEQNPEKAQKMRDILRRFHEKYKASLVPEYGPEVDELDSDDDEPPLVKRMKGVNLDDSAAVWKNMTSEEKKDFKRFAKDVEEGKVEVDFEMEEGASGGSGRAPRKATRAKPKLVEVIGEEAPGPSTRNVERVD